MTPGKATAGRPISDEADRNSLERYQRGPLQVGQTDSYDRHVVLDHAVSLEKASHRERFEAVARSLRDLLTQRWLLTEQTYESANAKRVYYLSMEFLIGRTLIHNIINMGVEQLVREDLRSDPRQDWTEVIDSEPDAGLGNGGLGRLDGLFHGFARDVGHSRDGVWSAVRLRDFSAGNRKSQSGRISRPLA
jgi:starch phosphorylase